MNNEIDLHGFAWEEAQSIVLTALMSLNRGEELKIITGNGDVLKYEVEDLIKEENYRYRYDGQNYGAIIVWKD